MAHQPVKPLINFEDPEQCIGDSPCSLCLHTYPEWELLRCEQCTERIHSMCWIFLRDAFKDLDEWPCVSCQLPLNQAIRLALRGSVASDDEATAKMLRRRVFFARQATNQARWAISKGSSRREAKETALQAMCQSISLRYTELPETPQPSTARQQGELSMPSLNSFGGSQMSYTSTLSSTTDKNYNHPSSQVSTTQHSVTTENLAKSQPTFSLGRPSQGQPNAARPIEARYQSGQYRLAPSTTELKEEVDVFGQRRMLHSVPLASAMHHITPDLDMADALRYQTFQKIRGAGHGFSTMPLRNPSRRHDTPDLDNEDGPAV